MLVRRLSRLGLIPLIFPRTCRLLLFSLLGISVSFMQGLSHFSVNLVTLCPQGRDVLRVTGRKMRIVGLQLHSNVNVFYKILLFVILGLVRGLLAEAPFLTFPKEGTILHPPKVLDFPLLALETCQNDFAKADCLVAVCLGF